MPNETPVPEPARPTFHLIPTLIFVGSALLAGIVAGLITNAIF
jgi:hypothetical protein